MNAHLCLYLQKVTDLLAGIVLTNVKEIKAIDVFTTGISMVNDKDTAILISDLMLRFGKELDESVALFSPVVMRMNLRYIEKRLVLSWVKCLLK